MDIDFTYCAGLMKALSDETRLRIIKMISGRELCACDILEQFHITQPTLSYHMKILCECGLVEGRKDGVWMKYTLNREVLDLLKQLFDNIGLSTEEINDSCSCSKC